MNPKIRWLLWCCLSLALVWPAGLTVHGADAPPLKDEELDQMLAPDRALPRLTAVAGSDGQHLPGRRARRGEMGQSKTQT